MKPIVKQSELDNFNKWKENLIKEFVETYVKGLNDTFGERAFQVKTKLEIAGLENRLTYEASIYTGQIVIEDDYHSKK